MLSFSLHAHSPIRFRLRRMEHFPNKTTFAFLRHTHIPIHQTLENENLLGQSALPREKEENQEAKPCSSACRRISVVVWTRGLDGDISPPLWRPIAVRDVQSPRR